MINEIFYCVYHFYYYLCGVIYKIFEKNGFIKQNYN